LGALSGLGLEWGRIFAVLATIILVRRLLASDRVSTRLWSLLAGLATFWLTTALARAHLHDPAATRYLYVGAIYVILIVAEVWRPRFTGRRAAVVGAVALAFVVVANLASLRSGKETLQVFSDDISARLTALEIVGVSAVGRNFQPAPELAPRIRAGPYFDAVADFGSAAASPASLESMSGRARLAADAVLIRALARVDRDSSKMGGAAAPSVDRVTGGSAVSTGSCVVLRPRIAGASIEVAVPESALLVRPLGGDSVMVRLRRMADVFATPDVSVAPGSAATIRLRPDASDVPWRARASADSPVEICAAREQ